MDLYVIIMQVITYLNPAIELVQLAAIRYLDLIYLILKVENNIWVWDL